MLGKLKITSNYPRATRVLDGFRKYVVSQAKRNLTMQGHKASGKLHSSIKGYIEKKMNRNMKGRFTGGSEMPSLTFSMNEYGKYIDYGVRGSKKSPMSARRSPYKFTGRFKSVPMKPITNWCKRKGIQTSAAYPIAKSIYEKGIAGSMFFLKPYNKRLKVTLNKYHAAVADDIANNIANQIEKKLKQKLKKGRK